MRPIKHRKWIALLLAFLLPILQTGCGNLLIGEKEELVLATGGTSGTYFSAGSVMATVLNPLLERASISVLSSGGSGDNLKLLSEKYARLAIVQNDVMYYAYTGTDVYEGKDEFKDFSAVCGLYDESVQIVTCRPDIRTVEDLRGRFVSVGDAGSGVEFNAKQVLEAYGISFSDIGAVNAPFDESAIRLLNGTLDAAFIVAGAPTKAVTELAERTDVHLVAIDAQHTRALQESYGFYTDAVIPAGTYKGLDSEVDTVSVRATLIASDRVDEAVVYEILSQLFEQKDSLAEGEKKFSELNLQDAVKGIDIPFHPGAEKYYREHGAEGF